MSERHEQEDPSANQDHLKKDWYSLAALTLDSAGAVCGFDWLLITTNSSEHKRDCSK